MKIEEKVLAFLRNEEVDLNEANERVEEGPWTYEKSGSSIHLMNMKKLSNAIDIFKYKGTGDKPFYITYKNSPAKLSNYSVDGILNFLRGTGLPMPSKEIVQKFIDNLNSL